MFASLSAAAPSIAYNCVYGSVPVCLVNAYRRRNEENTNAKKLTNIFRDIVLGSVIGNLVGALVSVAQKSPLLTKTWTVLTEMLSYAKEELIALSPNAKIALAAGLVLVAVIALVYRKVKSAAETTVPAAEDAEAAKAADAPKVVKAAEAADAPKVVKAPEAAEETKAVKAAEAAEETKAPEAVKAADAPVVEAQAPEAVKAADAPVVEAQAPEAVEAQAPEAVEAQAPEADKSDAV